VLDSVFHARIEKPQANNFINSERNDLSREIMLSMNKHPARWFPHNKHTWRTKKMTAAIDLACFVRIDLNYAGIIIPRAPWKSHKES
jgi:hypothetical protein